MRILVIEDEPRILGFLVRGLEGEGFSVDAARNGGEGLKRASRDNYDLVLLDLLLPGLDGLSVLNELSRGRPELPVVIVSARSASSAHGISASPCLPIKTTSSPTSTLSILLTSIIIKSIVTRPSSGQR